jgi:hypothetical protein
MAKRTEHSCEYPVSPEALLLAVTSSEYQVARETSQGALEATVNELTRSDARLVYEVHVTNYARGMTGVDRTKTEDAVATYTWDLERMRGDWTFKTVHGDRIKIWGALTIKPTAGGAMITSVFNAEIKIPLMGKRIEKMITKGVDENWSLFDETLRAHVRAP